MIENLLFDSFTYNPERRQDSPLINGYNLILSGAPSAEPVNPAIVEAINRKLQELEAKRIFLFQGGVLPNTPEARAEYDQRKQDGLLFDVRSIQLALSEIPKAFDLDRSAWPYESRYKKLKFRDMYGAHHDLAHYRQLVYTCRTPHVPVGSFYIVSGDVAMAMLLRGFPVSKEPVYKQSLRFKYASRFEEIKHVFKHIVGYDVPDSIDNIRG